uniref:Nephrocystin-4 n=1 Tax=Parastrongyloides trichosuri TaxID=131310 RepID=A0A0N5A6G1_PARTI
MGSPKEWYEYFCDNFYLPPPEKNKNGCVEDCFAISFKFIDAKNLKTSDFYRLNIYFFDANNRKYFGRNLVTKIVSSNSKNIKLSDEIFFHASLYCENIYFVIEVLEILPHKPKYPVCFGWSAFNLKYHTQVLVDYNVNKNVPKKSTTLPLFKGSGEILRYLDKPFDAISPPSNMQSADGSIQFIIQTHKAMEDCIELVPLFFPISKYESIPGILNICKGLKSKYLMGYLDNIAINYNGQEKAIEDGVIELLNKERSFTHNVVFDRNSLPQIKIFERRLKIGVHNGLCYVDEPTCVHISGKDQYNSTIWKTRSLTRIDKESSYEYDLNSFIVPNGVRLYKLFNDYRLAIVFSIEYVVGVEGSSGNIHDSKVIKFCWGAWCPFGDGSIDIANTVSIPLIGGPRENPDSLLCYKNLLKIRQNESRLQLDTTPKITLKCNFSLLSTQDDANLLSSKQISNRKSPRLNIDYTDSMNETIVDPRKLGNKINAPKEIPTTNFEHNSKITETNVSNKDKEEESNREYLPQIKFNSDNLAKVHDEIIVQKPIVANFTRSIFAAFSEGDFTLVYDYLGDKPTVNDILETRNINIPLEMHDKLCINEIIIQFLGINFLNNTFYDPSEKKNYFFTFQFYRFSLSTTEKLLADAKPYTKNDDPIILKRIDENNCIINDQGHGYTLKFTIDQSVYLQGKPDDFIKYLINTELSIDVWDADSLIHLGCAVIPLKNLCRQGQPAIQTFVQAAVIQNGLSHKDITTGVIFLSLSNIGRPSANVTLPVLKENHAIECKQLSLLDNDNQIICKVRAKRLPGINSNTLQQSFEAVNKVFDQKQLDFRQKLSEVIEKKFVETTFTEPVVSRVSRRKIVYEEEIENYKHVRNESKAGILLKAVFSSITTEHVMYVAEGETGFMEFLLQNFYPDNIECLIDISDDQLQVVTNAVEWRSLQKINNYVGVVENSMFHRDPNGGYRIYLKPYENVRIPFKYEEGLDGNENSYTKVIKVIFYRCDSGQPMSILELTVNSAPSYITRAFRFFSNYDETFSQVLKIKEPHQTTYESIKISDPEVICILKQPVFIPGHQEVAIKVQPNAKKTNYIHSFIIYFYNDPYFSKLEKCWRIYVHFLPKISSQIIYGQGGKMEIYFSDNTNNPEQVIKLYSSSKHLRCEPEGLFLMEKIKNSPIIINTLPTTITNRSVILSLVDYYLSRLKGMWLLDIVVKEPNIVKAYQVIIEQSRRETSTKSIHVSNPYGVQKSFIIKSSNEKLVQLPKDYFQIKPQSSITVDLNFLPVEVYQTTNCDVIIFLENADNGRQEEAYLLNITYKIE